MVKRYLWNIVISIDQLGNTLLGGNPDMTISGRMGRLIKQGDCYLCRPICKFISFTFRDPDHCSKQDILESDEKLDA